MSLYNSLPSFWQTTLADMSYQLDLIEEVLTIQANAGIKILPHKDNVFRALEIMPWDAKVIIVGQDPYPNKKHATGLSFSVPAQTFPLAGSLRNMLAEIESDIGKRSIASNGDLAPWVNQGVVLLNRSLTVQEGISGSHFKFGWQNITNRIIETYTKYNVVGLLMGGTAKEVSKFFTPNLLVTTMHPSPLSAHNGFFGSKPFSKVNNILISMNKEPIQW